MEIPVVSNERNGVFLSRRIDGKVSSFATVLGVERNANNSKRLTVRRQSPWQFFTHNGGLLEERTGEGAAPSPTEFGVILGKTSLHFPLFWLLRD